MDADEQLEHDFEIGRHLLASIRASLWARAEGRNEGGDIEIMRAVDAIVKREGSASRPKRRKQK